jgi:hypothetical protein
MRAYYNPEKQKKSNDGKAPSSVHENKVADVRSIPKQKSKVGRISKSFESQDNSYHQNLAKTWNFTPTHSKMPVNPSSTQCEEIKDSSTTVKGTSTGKFTAGTDQTMITGTRTGSKSVSKVTGIAKNIERKESSAKTMLSADRFSQDQFIGTKKSVLVLAKDIDSYLGDEKKTLVVEEQYWTQSSVEKAIESHKKNMKIVERLNSFRPNQVMDSRINSQSTLSQKLWSHLDGTTDQLEMLCGKVISRYERMVHLVQKIIQSVTQIAELLESNGNFKASWARLIQDVKELSDLSHNCEDLSKLSSALNETKIVGSKSLMICKFTLDECEEEKIKSPEYKRWKQLNQELKNVKSLKTALELKARTKQIDVGENAAKINVLKEQAEKLNQEIFLVLPEVQRLDEQFDQSQKLFQKALESVIGKVTFSEADLGHALSVISIVDELNEKLRSFEEEYWRLSRRMQECAESTEHHLSAVRFPIRNMTCQELVHFLGKNQKYASLLREKNVDGVGFLKMSQPELEKMLNAHHSSTFSKIHLRRFIRLQEEERDDSEIARKVKQIMNEVQTEALHVLIVG